MIFNLKRILILYILNYPTPINLSYYWNFGSILLFCLVVQIISGIFLSFWYIPSINDAFLSIEYIMRDVNYGWLIRYIHANGASLFFVTIYLHMLRGIYYSSFSYPRNKVWISGSIIFVILMGTAFFGYILPWGQMSYWAATVITSLLSAIPLIGDFLLTFIWGSLSVDQPTLSRIFSLHFIFPFILTGLIIIHILLLHDVGSGNPSGVKSYDNITFYPYFIIKDVLGILIILFVFSILIFFLPNLLLHPDNYIMANAEVTPMHIVPEWYFLLFYGILRSIPNKIAGILVLILSLYYIIFLPYCGNGAENEKFDYKSGRHRLIYRIFFFFFLFNCIILAWTAAKPIEVPYYLIGRITALYYFVYLAYILDKTSEYEEKAIDVLCRDKILSHWTINQIIKDIASFSFFRTENENEIILFDYIKEKDRLNYQKRVIINITKKRKI